MLCIGDEILYKGPTLITIILIALSVAVSRWLITSTSVKLTQAELVNSLIAIFACMGGLISATFVVFSYIQTNKAFMDSKKPFLLIKVKSEHLPPGPQQPPIPFTFIHYTNTSGNEFTDLTIKLKVEAGNSTIDISDLFSPKMFMAAHDPRNRRFETETFIAQHGLDINAEAQLGNPVILSTSYQFSFNKRIEERKGPNYKWNPQIRHWEIV